MSYDIIDALAALEALLAPSGPPPAPINPTLLREPCSPSDEVRGAHKHLCRCGACWKHSDAFSDSRTISAEDHELAHTCPKCGSEQYYKHH